MNYKIIFTFVSSEITKNLLTCDETAYILAVTNGPESIKHFNTTELQESGGNFAKISKLSYLASLDDLETFTVLWRSLTTNLNIENEKE